ncbi:hypothetical protein C1646_815492 [Rhizophagus diaphanus]|nr:hypothetical protein C1646_815492 [Rhizophagus diaphanus] [Rhizophagus sp. MUCL 43196]
MDNSVYRQIVNDALLATSACENIVIGNIIPFIEILKTFLLTRSKTSLSSANESMLQVIVEILLPLKYRIPELSLVMDGKKPKGLVSLIRNQKFGANELENLDKILEKEDEEIFIKRSYTYWYKEFKKTNQTTIGEVLKSGISQLESYMNTISKGKVVNYSSSGVLDERVKTIKSNPNKLKGFVILVIGFHCIIWKPVEEKEKDSKIILKLMENHEENENWFSSIIGFFYENGINNDNIIVDKNKSSKLYSLKNILNPLLKRSNESQNVKKKELVEFNNLGYLYQYGIGKKKDEFKAFEFYLESAEGGNSDALIIWVIVIKMELELKRMERKLLNGVKKDNEKAFEWYFKSAERGYLSAQNTLVGCLYLKKCE